MFGLESSSASREPDFLGITQDGTLIYVSKGGSNGSRRLHVGTNGRLHRVFTRRFRGCRCPRRHVTPVFGRVSLKYGVGQPTYGETTLTERDVSKFDITEGYWRTRITVK